MRTLHVRTPDGPEWWLGTANDPEALVVEAPLYDVFRALAGRRSKDQVREWSWSAEPRTRHRSRPAVPVPMGLGPTRRLTRS